MHLVYLDGARHDAFHDGALVGETICVFKEVHYLERKSSEHLKRSSAANLRSTDGASARCSWWSTHRSTWNMEC